MKINIFFETTQIVCPMTFGVQTFDDIILILSYVELENKLKFFNFENRKLKFQTYRADWQLRLSQPFSLLDSVQWIASSG